MEALERAVLSHDWITLLLLAAFIFLVVAKTIYPYKFVNFSQLAFTNKYLLLEGREPKIFQPFHILLFAVNVISVSLLLFLFFKVWGKWEINRPIVFFIRVATSYTAFVLLKFGIEKILANILSVEKRMEFYLFYKMSYRNFMAMILLPISLVFVYVFQPGWWSFYLLGGIVLLINLIVFFGMLKKNRRYILGHLFYFILYLCALEIGPYFILYKLITT